MDFNDSNRDPSQFDSSDSQHQHENISDVDELKEYDGFEDAAECPNCGVVRPFGADCLRCGWEPEDSQSSSSSSDSNTAQSLDRVVFAIITARSEDIAATKAEASLKHRSGAGQGSDFDLVAEFDDPDRLFPGKWGDLSAGIRSSNKKAEQIIEQVTTTIGRDEFDVGGASSPLVYSEDGTPLTSSEAIQSALDGEMTLTGGSDDPTWIVPAVLYSDGTSGSSATDSTSGPATRQLDCHNCPGTTTHTYDGKGATESDPRPVEHIWVCDECGCGQYAEPPADS